MMSTRNGTPLAWEIVAGEGEPITAAKVIKRYADNVLPKRAEETISVCACDGGFQSPRVHEALKQARVVPVIHKATHAKTDSGKANVARKSNDWKPFHHDDPGKRHYSNWLINGLEEIRCQCGEGHTERLVNVKKNGEVAIGTKGVCANCGSVTIQSGRWARAQHPDRVRMVPHGQGTPSIGNPLHYNDPLAEIYGKGRFNWNESIHATIQSRFGMLGRAPFRSLASVRAEFAIVTIAISVLLLHRSDPVSLRAQKTGVCATTHLITPAGSFQVSKRSRITRVSSRTLSPAR
jgi:hypothetical protein